MLSKHLTLWACVSVPHIADIRRELVQSFQAPEPSPATPKLQGRHVFAMMVMRD